MYRTPVGERDHNYTSTKTDKYKKMLANNGEIVVKMKAWHANRFSIPGLHDHNKTRISVRIIATRSGKQHAEKYQ